MERSQEGERTLAERVVHWRTVGLIGACVAGGVTLSMMVIGSVPSIAGPVGAAPEALPAEVVVGDQPTTVPVDVATTETLLESIEQPTDAAVAAPEGIVEASAVVAGPVGLSPAAPTVAPAAPSPTPTVAPAPAAAPTPAAPTPKVTPAPTAAPAPAPTAAPAPAPTAAPTTAAPTTAVPTTQPALPPTTQAPATVSSLTYPSYTVSGVSDVSLQFDGASIYVVSLTPQSKWVYEIEKNGPRTVEIKFFNVDTGRDREFHATVESGRIKVET
jgi:hypothetical protein